MYLDIDIETIPSQDPSIRERLEKLVKHPAQMKKADTIAAWVRDEKPAAVEKAWRETALDGAYGHVISAAFIVDDGMTWTIDPIPKSVITDYASMLDVERNFLQALFDGIASVVDRRMPVVSGHNILFDVKFMWRRAVVLGVKPLPWWPHNARPWDDRIFDTSAYWCDYGDKIGLDELCAILGIAGKGDVDGSKVYDLWLAEENDKIQNYNIDDTVRAATARRRMLFLDLPAPGGAEAGRVDEVFDAASGEVVTSSTEEAA